MENRALYCAHRIPLKNGLYMKWPQFNSSFFRYKDFSKFLIFLKIFQKNVIFTILGNFWKITKIQISLSDRRMLVVIDGCVENLPEVLRSISHTDNDGMWPIESNLWMIEISWYSRILSWFCWYSEIANPCTDWQFRYISKISSKFVNITKFQSSRGSILWVTYHHCQYVKCFSRPQVSFPRNHLSPQAFCGRWEKFEFLWFSRNFPISWKSRFFGIFSKISKIWKNPYSERMRN